MPFDKTESIRHAKPTLGPAGGQVATPTPPGPRLSSAAAYPACGKLVEYEISAVITLRTEPTAEDSLALIFARSRFGIAIAAMIRMIATTISSSISEKPFCLRIVPFSLVMFLNLGL